MYLLNNYIFTYIIFKINHGGQGNCGLPKVFSTF